MKKITFCVCGRSNWRWVPVVANWECKSCGRVNEVDHNLKPKEI